MKLIVVSNRLPYKIIDDNIIPSDGGLSSCLNNINLDFLWIGWLNTDIDNSNIKCIKLTESEESRYYNNFCNKFLWYIFNDNFTKYYDNIDYEFYQKVNMKFAKKIFENIKNKDDVIWINDYHLFFVAKYLKQIYNVQNNIIYIHHIQVPENVNQLNCSLPNNFVECMQYYNYISCHTDKFKNNFYNLLKMNNIYNVKLLTNPIGINNNFFKERANFSKITKESKKITILGIDRLDFVKGLEIKFQAFDALLRKYPDLKNKIELFQLIIPSRESVNMDLKNRLERQISKINGFHTDFFTETPIKYKYGRVDINNLVSMYKNSDICLITSFADGMNLVSLEYCICNPNGILCLSNRAGSTEYLKGAVTFNPYNLNEIVNSIYECYSMREEEKLDRMKKNIEFVNFNNSVEWSNRLLNLNMEKKNFIFCDYDGTLTPIVENPDDAKPGPEQIKLLNTLCANEANIVYIISGRSKDTMENWFGEIDNLLLSAEHGEFLKYNGNWINYTNIFGIEDKKKSIIEEFIKDQDNLIIENKCSSVNLNFNFCEDKYESEVINLKVKNILDRYKDINLKKGLNCIEFSFSKRNKGDIVKEIIKKNSSYNVFAFGDEKTDEDMFKVLNKSNHYTYKVGNSETNAKFKLNNTLEVHEILNKINSNNYVQFKKENLTK